MTFGELLLSVSSLKSGTMVELLQNPKATGEKVFISNNEISGALENDLEIHGELEDAQEIIGSIECL